MLITLPELTGTSLRPCALGAGDVLGEYSVEDGVVVHDAYCHRMEVLGIDFVLPKSRLASATRSTFRMLPEGTWRLLPNPVEVEWGFDQI